LREKADPFTWPVALCAAASGGMTNQRNGG
jgi:hypothetical protein